MVSRKEGEERFVIGAVSACVTCGGTLRVMEAWAAIGGPKTVAWWHESTPNTPAERDHVPQPMGDLCARCDVRTVLHHHSRVCKKDSLTRSGHHWCCPEPSGCELESADGRAQPDPLAAEGAPQCSNCGGDGTVSHRTTFCKVTGMCNEVEHWCCPKACELDAQHLRQMRRENAYAHLNDVLAAAERDGSHRGRKLEHGAMRLWSYGGAVLPAGEHGLVSVADLAAFARYLEVHDPDGRVLLHAYGLRWGRSLGTDDGPRLEWRDWD